jgi:hypothetical protein
VLGAVYGNADRNDATQFRAEQLKVTRPTTRDNTTQGGYDATRTIEGLLVVLAVVVTTAARGAAQNYDHLAMFKIKGFTEVNSAVDLLGRNPSFSKSGCRVSGKPQYFMAPVAKQVTSFPPPPYTLDNPQQLEELYACYKLKCPGAPPLDSLVGFNQLAADTFTRRIPRMLCLPTRPNSPACDTNNPACTMRSGETAARSSGTGRPVFPLPVHSRSRLQRRLVADLRRRLPAGSGMPNYFGACRCRRVRERNPGACSPSLSCGPGTHCGDAGGACSCITDPQTDCGVHGAGQCGGGLCPGVQMCQQVGSTCTCQ